jgi:methyl-accepting chemotaxis protein
MLGATAFYFVMVAPALGSAAEPSLGALMLTGCAVAAVLATASTWFVGQLAGGLSQCRTVMAGQGDELAALKGEAQEKAAILKSVEGLFRQCMTGDLSARMADVAPAYEDLRQVANAYVEVIEQGRYVLAGNVEGIRASIDEISQSAEDLSRRTESQAASLEESAAALDHLTGAIRKTADFASEADQAVVVAKAQAEGSGQVVREAAAAMGELERSANEISQIIGVIDEIAFQTNLLALNAGVEAARAGDAGRGFAVVASEVRSLAQRSAGAAKEIKNLIATSSAQVKGGVELVRHTGEALTAVASKVSEISVFTSEIASSAKEQALGLQEVNAAIAQMDQVTQQNAAMVEESTAACFALASEVRLLTALAEQDTEKVAGVDAARAPPSRTRLAKVSGGGPRLVQADAGGWEEF